MVENPVIASQALRRKQTSIVKPSSADVAEYE